MKNSKSISLKQKQMPKTKNKTKIQRTSPAGQIVIVGLLTR